MAEHDDHFYIHTVVNGETVENNSLADPLVMATTVCVTGRTDLFKAWIRGQLTTEVVTHVAADQCGLAKIFGPCPAHPDGGPHPGAGRSSTVGGATHG